MAAWLLTRRRSCGQPVANQATSFRVDSDSNGPRSETADLGAVARLSRVPFRPPSSIESDGQRSLFETALTRLKSLRGGARYGRAPR